MHPDDEASVIEDFVAGVFGEEPNRHRPDDEPLDELSDLRYYVASESEPVLALLVDKLLVLREQPVSAQHRELHAERIWDVTHGGVPVAEWLDLQLGRLRTAIEDKRAGRLTVDRL